MDILMWVLFTYTCLCVANLCAVITVYLIVFGMVLEKLREIPDDDQ